MERKRLSYGIPNFRKVTEEGYVFVDKTPFVERLEKLGEAYIFFLRPRKFGKSLFISMLEHYYDIKYRDKFESLFGDFYIGKHPTPLHNSYLVLLFDFSGIDTTDKETTYRGFRRKVQDLRVGDLRAAMRQMAYDGKVEKLIVIVEDFLSKVLSNRDLRGFRESHLKVHILTLLHLSRLFYIQSEMEAERGYVDIFLREAPQFPVDYEWVLELKYIQKEKMGDLNRSKTEGEGQLKRYMDKVRSRTRCQLKGALFIFTGKGECVFKMVVHHDVSLLPLR